jgi:hypothetical protein
MRILRNLVLVASVFLLAFPASAQFGRGGRPPQIRGILNPTIGSGAVYQSKDGEIEISLVGKEDVDGKQGYWIQMGSDSREGRVYVKQLWVVDGNNSTMTRMIMQPPSGGAMEMPTSMFGALTSMNLKNDGHLVGTESITTPAGTFSCEHYQANNNSWDSWVAANIPPWGLVKAKDAATGEMVLLRTFTGALDRIKGKPQKLEMPEGFQMPQRFVPGP